MCKSLLVIKCDFAALREWQTARLRVHMMCSVMCTLLSSYVDPAEQRLSTIAAEKKPKCSLCSLLSSAAQIHLSNQVTQVSVNVRSWISYFYIPRSIEADRPSMEAESQAPSQDCQAPTQAD